MEKLYIFLSFQGSIDAVDENEEPKEIIATKVSGTVKWFNVKSGYGFINRNDTKEDVFVHQTAIVKNNPKKVSNFKFIFYNLFAAIKVIIKHTQLNKCV